MAHNDTEGLRKLMQLKVTTSRTKLRNILTRKEKLENILRDLSSHSTSTAENGTHQDMSIAAFQNEMRLQRWLDQRRALVNTELAQIHALIAMAQDDLSQQIARQEALENVAGRLKRKADLQRQRRADYWS